jgi:glycosyltransferase involved in cell wall biosynthesis
MMTVGFLPWWFANPYQILLKQELNKLGVRVIGNPPLSLAQLLIGRDGLDVVHVHWPHGTYKTLPQMLHVLVLLIAYRLLKNNIVWTVHELDAYESRHPRRDSWFRSAVMWLSRRLVVHGEHTRRELIERYRYRRPIDVVRHPSYTGWYPDTIGRNEARTQLNLPAAARVYLYFGYIKPYKGVEDLIQAFRALDDDTALLVIAGKPMDETIQREIESLAAPDARIRTHLAYIPDEAIQQFFRAADVVVFPFQHTQTSGSLMLALTYGCPVIAPAIATIPEYLDAHSSVLFHPGRPGDLLRALRDAAAAPLDAMGVAARQQADTHTWAAMAAVHVAAYRAASQRS